MTSDPSGDGAPSREDVFRELFVAAYPRVLRYCVGQVGDRAQAEDIAAEVFRIAWEKFDPTEPFGVPWLIRTAMHKTRDHHRRAYRGAAAVESLAQLSRDAPEALAEVDRLALLEALGTLGEKDQQIIRLTYWDALSAPEVAAVLRMRPGTVWVRLTRARARLRAALSEGEGRK